MWFCHLFWTNEKVSLKTQTIVCQNYHHRFLQSLQCKTKFHQGLDFHLYSDRSFQTLLQDQFSAKLEFLIVTLPQQIHFFIHFHLDFCLIKQRKSYYQFFDAIKTHLFFIVYTTNQVFFHLGVCELTLKIFNPFQSESNLDNKYSQIL